MSGHGRGRGGPPARPSIRQRQGHRWRTRGDPQERVPLDAQPASLQVLEELRRTAPRHASGAPPHPAAAVSGPWRTWELTSPAAFWHLGVVAEALAEELGPECHRRECRSGPEDGVGRTRVREPGGVGREGRPREVEQPVVDLGVLQLAFLGRDEAQECRRELRVLGCQRREEAPATTADERRVLALPSPGVRRRARSRSLPRHRPRTGRHRRATARPCPPGRPAWRADPARSRCPA